MQVHQFPILTRLFALLLGLQSCVVIPTPSGTDKFELKDIAFLQQGVTSKADVAARLGNPDIFWETERVFVYRWQRQRAILLWVVPPPPGGTGGAAGTVPWESDHALIIQFDQEDRVQRFELGTRLPLQDYGDFLSEWVKDARHTPASKAAEKRETP